MNGYREMSKLALENARQECRRAGFNPEDHHEELLRLLVAECRNATREMASDYKQGGVTGIIAVTNFAYVYFADAGSRAAQKLIAAHASKDNSKSPSAPGSR